MKYGSLEHIDSSESALSQYDSALDELGAVCDATTIDEVGYALFGADSAASELLACLEELVQEQDAVVRPAIEEAISLAKTNLKMIQDAVAHFKAESSNIPSDGEQREAALESLAYTASELYDELGEFNGLSDFLTAAAMAHSERCD